MQTNSNTYLWFFNILFDFVFTLLSTFIFCLTFFVQKVQIKYKAVYKTYFASLIKITKNRVKHVSCQCSSSMKIIVLSEFPY